MNEHDNSTRVLEPLPDYGKHMTMERWKSYVRDGLFIDYDGSASYATESMMDARDEDLLPSQLEEGTVEEGWTHVVWFNR